MNLHINWLKPATLPSCDYKVSYRRMGDAVYTTLETSGNTSGITSGTADITVSAPACYEGYVQSNCCSDNYSEHDPWGVNAYSTLGVTIAISGITFQATITSTYANPYDIVITGTFVSNQQGTLPFTATYPAGSTTATVLASGSTPTGSNLETCTGVTITAISPVFNNGGQLQQEDPVSTPEYFEFYATSGDTSGATTTYGNPLTLPSFILRQFNTTEVDVSGNPIAGELLVAWIQDSVYLDAVFPYDTITLTIQEDGTATVLGTGVITAGTNGIRELSIYMVKGLQPIATSTLYKMQMYWTDDTQPPVHSSRTFYLPDL